MSRLTAAQLKDLVLGSFEDERTHRVTEGLARLHPDFKVTDAWISGDQTLFPSWQPADATDSIDDVYQIEGREYEFHVVVADEPSQTVIVEFVESYPDPKTGQVYRTPQVAICEMKDGLLWRTRHYGDPRTSFMNLTKDQTDRLFE